MEIMIVVAIIAAVVAIGAPRLANTKGKMRGAVQRVAVLAREVHNSALLQNRTFRIAISMDPEKGDSFWVESAPGQVALLSEEQQKELDEKTSMRQEELEEVSGPKFEFETKFMKQPETLPKELRIDLVEYAGKKQAIKRADDQKTTAYIHFFPQGLTEKSLIQFSDGKSLAWTVGIHPLTGRGQVYDKKLTLKDIGE